MSPRFKLIILSGQRRMTLFRHTISLSNGDRDVIEEQGCKPKGPLRANSGTERI